MATELLKKGLPINSRGSLASSMMTVKTSLHKINEKGSVMKGDDSGRKSKKGSTLCSGQ